MKIASSLKSLKKRDLNSKLVRRRGKVYIINKKKQKFKVREYNRCPITGRPRGFIRRFGMSRNTFRKLASAGLIPGVKKASL